MANISYTYPAYATLQSSITANYSISAAYYKQRKEQFIERFFVKRAAEAEKDVEYFSSQITAYFSKQAENFKTEVQRQAVRILKQGGPKTNDEEIFVANYSELFTTDKNGKPIINWSKMGTEYERFVSLGMTQEMVQSVQKDVDSFTANTLNSLILQFGSTVQKSAITSSAKQTRTDMLMTRSKSRHKPQVEVTETVVLEVNEADVAEKYKEKMAEYLQNLQEQILQGGISANDLKSFGFQIKLYNTINTGNKWSKSSVIKEQVEKAFSSSGDKTWSSAYATLYPSYLISKQLISVINPVNIGLITGSGLIWMDAVLSKARMYMEVTWDSPTNPRNSNSERGGGVEIYPRLVNDVILFYALDNAQKSLFTNNGTEGTSKMLQSKVKKETIKVAQISLTK